MIAANNLSRKIFKNFVERNLIECVDRRNVFDDIKTGKRYAFCVSQDTSISIECRQFYDDCVGLICFDAAANVLLEMDKEYLSIRKGVNRINANGNMAYTAKCYSKIASKSTYNKPRI